MKHTKYFAFLLLLVSFFAFNVTSFAQEVTPEPEAPPEPCSIFFDDFEDGDLLAPDWADSNGTAFVDAGQVTASSDTVLSLAVAATTTADVLEFGFDGSVSANEALVMTLNGTDGNSYSISLTSGLVDLLGNGGVLLSGAAATDTLHTLRATRSAGTLELFINGASAGTTADPFGTTEFDGVALVMIGSPVGDNIDIVADCTVAVNQPPVAEDFEVITVEDTAVSFNFLDHASDPDGDALTVLLDSDVQAGSLSVDEDGNATFTPDAEWGGAVSATYHVNDGELDSNVATVWIQVLPVNDAPNCDALATDVSIIWPPNHKMVPVAIDESSVSDVDSTQFEINLTDITHDEDINGLGDGNTDPDWDIEAGTVRAERSGLGDGRTYTISANVDDLDWTGTYENLSGNPAYDYDESILIDEGDCDGSADTFVPHDMGGGNDDSEEIVVEEIVVEEIVVEEIVVEEIVVEETVVEEAASEASVPEVTGPNLPPTANENAVANANANASAGKGNNNAGGNDKGNNNSDAPAADTPSNNGNGNANGKGNGKGNK